MRNLQKNVLSSLDRFDGMSVLVGLFYVDRRMCDLYGGANFC